MNEEDLIKEKLKQSRRQLKEEKSGNFKIVIFGIIVGIIYSAITILIPIETKWFTLSVICYMFSINYIARIIITAYRYGKENNNIFNNEENMFWPFFIVSTIALLIVCLQIRKIGLIISCIIAIANFIIIVLTHVLVDRIALIGTFKEYYEINDLGRKAIKIENKRILKFILVLTFISAFLSIPVGITAIKSKSIGYMLIMFGVMTALSVFITKIVLKLVTKNSEKAINVAFNLDMGEITKSTYNSKTWNKHIIYNMSVMKYRVLSSLIIFIGLLLLSKFDLATSCLASTVQIIFSSLYPEYDEGYEYESYEHTVATTYDKYGNKTGEIKKKS